MTTPRNLTNAAPIEASSNAINLCHSEEFCKNIRMKEQLAYLGRFSIVYTGSEYFCLQRSASQSNADDADDADYR
jgi:hypothetical protein